MKKLLKLRTAVLITLSLSLIQAVPIDLMQRNISAKSVQSPLSSKILKNITKSNETNRTFYPPLTVHSSPVYLNGNPPNQHPSYAMKERPPIPPPPYPSHMIDLWQSYYGYDQPHSSNKPPQQGFHSSKDHFNGYISRPTWWKPTEITRPQLITKPKPSTTLPTTSAAMLINNHKNPSHSSNKPVTVSSTILEFRDPTKKPLMVQGKPVSIVLPSATPITKVASAKQKAPTVIVSRPITVVHPDRYVNTTIHSNLIVAQRPRPNFPNRRPSTSQGQRPNRPAAGSQSYVAIQPPLPFLAPIIIPSNTFSTMITGVQAMNNFVRSTIWSTIAFFIPSAILALGLYAANNREGAIDLPPVPSLSAGDF